MALLGSSIHSAEAECEDQLSSEAAKAFDMCRLFTDEADNQTIH